jgi:hypothetical protein
LIVTVPLALAVKVPAELLLITIVHVRVLPLPESVGQVPPVEPGAGVTFVPVIANADGDRPVLPGMPVNVTVNVCAVPTSFVALGEIEIAASTYFLVASSVPPGP